MPPWSAPWPRSGRATARARIVLLPDRSSRSRAPLARVPRQPLDQPRHARRPLRRQRRPAGLMAAQQREVRLRSGCRRSGSDQQVQLGAGRPSSIPPCAPPQRHEPASSSARLWTRRCPLAAAMSAFRQPDGPAETACRHVDQHRFSAHLPQKVLGHRRLPARQAASRHRHGRAHAAVRFHLAAMKAAPCGLGLPPAVPCLALGTAHNAGRIAGRHPPSIMWARVGNACRQAEALDSSLQPLAKPLQRIATGTPAADTVNSCHGVAPPSWIQHPEPTGSSCPTPALLFQHPPGHPQRHHPQLFPGATRAVEPRPRGLSGVSLTSSARVSGRRGGLSRLCRARCRSDRSRWSTLPRDESCRVPCTPDTSQGRRLLALRPFAPHVILLPPPHSILLPPRTRTGEASAVAARAGMSRSD